LKTPAIDAAVSSPNSEEALQKAILDLAAQGIFAVIPDRKHKFPEGESLDDLTVRAGRALRECVLTHFAEYAENGCREDVHVVAVSHGLCISEMMAVLVRLDPQADHKVSYKGLLNTAWTRAVITARVCRFE
jgi:broad specificity phosphatase PhoE